MIICKDIIAVEAWSQVLLHCLAARHIIYLEQPPHGVVAMSYRCHGCKHDKELLETHTKLLANLEARLMALEKGMPKLNSCVVPHT